MPKDKITSESRMRENRTFGLMQRKGGLRPTLPTLLGMDIPRKRYHQNGDKNGGAQALCLMGREKVRKTRRSLRWKRK